MTPTTPTPQHLQAFARTQQRYAPPKDEPVSFYIQGGYGTGKTSFLLTGRRPILSFAFDPGYMALESVRRAVDEGWLYVNYFGNDDESNPTAFKNWEQLVMQYEREKVFQHFGTIGIDSGTYWLSAMINQIRKHPETADAKFERPTGVMTQADYMPYYGYIEKWVRRLQINNVALVFSHHLTIRETTKKIGGSETTIQEPVALFSYGRAQELIASLFSERYMMIKEPMGQKQKYVCYTNNVGCFSAATRMGSTKFDWREEPDIKKLLTKAGLPTEDKPWSKIVQPQTT